MRILMMIMTMLIMGIVDLSGQTNSSKEVLVLGAMHTVPKILKNSYKPLYKKALDYGSERIYVEKAMPNDSLSWAYLKDSYAPSIRKFYMLSDSMRAHYDFNPDQFNQTLDKDLNQMSKSDFAILIKGLAYLTDAPNYSFYKLIDKHGLDFKRNFRHENQELTAKLAIALNHRKIFATDDQQTNGEFQQNWHKCDKQIKGTEYSKRKKKLSNKMTRRMILPALFGRFGIACNKWKYLEILNRLSGLFYSQGAFESCDLAIEYWRQRNMRIARNLGSQINNSDVSKSILIIGAAHLVGVKEELQKQFPEIKVITLNELN